MADDEHDYKVGPGRPPLHTRFQTGQSGNPGGRSKKKVSALLADASSRTSLAHFFRQVLYYRRGWEKIDSRLGSGG